MRRRAVLCTTVALIAAFAMVVVACDRSQTAGRTPVAQITPRPEFARGLTLLSASAGPQRTRQVAARIAGLRLMNYYPADAGWTRMWTNWNPGVLRHDFALIRSLGANAVRLGVFPYTFGWPTLSARLATRFADTVKIAAAAGLGVQVTLFDWWRSYRDIAQSRAWLKAFLRPYAADPEIQLIEIKNEVNLANGAEVAWVRAMLPTLRTVMPRTPSTVSVSGTEGPAGFVQLRRELAGAPLDVADLHFYGSAGSAYSWMLAAKRAAGSLPLFVGEIGFPVARAYPGGQAAADLTQAHWYSAVFAAARAAGVPTPAPWTLYDFKPGALPASVRNPRASDFGLYSAAGKPGPAVRVVAQAFRLACHC